MLFEECPNDSMKKTLVTSSTHSNVCNMLNQIKNLTYDVDESSIDTREICEDLAKILKKYLNATKKENGIQLEQNWGNQKEL